MKRTFLESFANDPAQFIQTWLESQSRDLENIMGSGPSEGATVRQEELKRSEFFQLPWVEEVCISLLLSSTPLILFALTIRLWLSLRAPVSRGRACPRRVVLIWSYFDQGCVLYHCMCSPTYCNPFDTFFVACLTAIVPALLSLLRCVVKPGLRIHILILLLLLT